MLEGLATWFLNNYLGKYLELLDTAQLSISLLAGQVELENVPLRKDALRFLEPSVAVRSGQVGHIKLTVPVARMRSEPWTLLLEQVHIVLGPQRFAEYDEEAEDAVRLETKLAALDGIEAEWRAAQETAGSSYYPVTSGWLDYGASFIGTIVENLQLTVRDVHVRYEDDLTIPGTVFSAGLTLSSLTARTCDQTWSPRFVHRDAAQGQLDAFKLVELTGLAAYLQPHTVGLADTPCRELAGAMGAGAPGGDREFLLEPVSATANLRRHCLGRPLGSRRQPRLRADVAVEQLNLRLSDLQFQRGVAGARAIHMLRRSRQFWRWRPGESVQGHARRWWRYAITCTLDLVHSRRRSQTWGLVLQAARDNVVYVEAFTAQLVSPNTMSDELRVVKEAQDSLRSYEELRALREVAVQRLEHARAEAVEPEPEVVEEPQAPTLQRWFPLWGGWYDTGQGEAEEEERAPPRIEEYLQDALKEDQEVLGVAHKDVVFSHLTVHLTRASVRLVRALGEGGQGQLLFDIQFDDVKATHESRPRTGSLLAALTLGAVHLRDRITRNSLFPLLIAPQSSAEAPLCPSKAAANTRLSELARSLQSLLPSGLGPAREEQEPLLDFLYELKPFGSKADHRVHVRSQPLDIVYNPIVIKVVSEFFRIPEDLNRTSHLSERIRSAALHRLQEAKQRTREEFTRNINQILQGSSLDRKVWDIMLDLSAPKLLVPDHFEDKDAPLIVVDFGKLRLSNQPAARAAGGPSPAEPEEDEEMFVTPASSPGSGAATPVGGPEHEVLLGDSEALLHSKMYDRFAVDFNNMQIIVGRVRDNWKGAHLKGNSSLHVVDRFSIALRVERRTVETADPAWPSLVVAATLPRLQLHVNEEKVVTLRHMVARLLGPDYGGRTEAATQTAVQAAAEGEEAGAGDETLALWSEWEPDSGADVSAKLLVAHFTVSDVSLELQSQGRPVAELQVTNMKAGLTRRPYDTNLSLSVHSLLLVDALQTLGPDYELLVASHRSVTVDSVSGSLRGSDPASPASPGSPGPGPGHPVTPSQHELSRALSSIGEGLSPPSDLSPAPPAILHLPTDIADPNALISIEVMLVSPKCPTLEDEDELRIVNVQFNSLDVIANQETIIELIGFCRRVFPAGPPAAYQSPYTQPSLLSTEAACQTDLSLGLGLLQFDIGGEVRRDGLARRTELTAEFQRLNVLLLRAETGRRIGTALLTDARVQATLAKGGASGRGSLGGLQVRNLLSASPVHQRIVSVGREPVLGPGLASGPTPPALGEAFTFSLQQRPGDGGREEESLAVKLHISSVVYTNSAAFVEELNNCAADFKRCMAGLASSITAAAADLALGIVSGAYREATPGRAYSATGRQEREEYRSLPRLQRPGRPAAPVLLQPGPAHRGLPARLELEAELETPVLVFPRRETSLEVLVAHLGRITLTNSRIGRDDFEEEDEGEELPLGAAWIDRYSVRVHNVNLTSLSLESQLQGGPEAEIHLLTAQRLFDSSRHGVPILHDTHLEVTVDRANGHEPEGTDLTRIRGRVVNPLKVSLSRNQYQQLLDTLSRAGPGPAPAPCTPPRPGLPEALPRGRPVRLEGSFELPLLSIELRRDALNAAIEPGIVSMTCTDFGLVYDRAEEGASTVQMALRGLVMEDLLLAEDSAHRNLMLSSGCPATTEPATAPRAALSTSCPDLRARLDPESRHSKSLPDSLDTKSVFGVGPGAPGRRYGAAAHRADRREPSTPPPSARCSPAPPDRLRRDLTSQQNLVHLSILNVDPAGPDYMARYGGTNKFVNVDFNSLDINFNLQTWVVLLDFFGIGSGPGAEEVAAPTGPEPAEDGPVLQATEIDIAVKSLSVCFNRNEKDLFKSTVLNYVSKIILKDGNFSIDGQLGNFCIKDLTSHGILYRDRFLCRGEQILRFKVFKFGRPDPDLEREHDISVDLRMAAITYVHTQRFYSLMLDFFNQFQQLQATMSSHRTVGGRPPGSVSFRPPEPGSGRGSRVKLLVEAVEPLLVLPLSSYSGQAILIDLGRLEIHNGFQVAGSAGTISASKLSTLRSGELGGRRSRAQSGSRSSRRSGSSARSGERRGRRTGGLVGGFGSSDEEWTSPPRPVLPSHKCLLDVMHVTLRSLDLCVADRLSAFTAESERRPQDLSVGSCLLRRQTLPLLKESCQLKLQIERNLDKGFSHNVPDLSVKGLLSQVHAVVDVEQYKLVRGFLAHNLGEQVEPMGEEEADLLGQPAPGGGPEDELWTSTFMDIELHGVTVDLVEEHRQAPHGAEAGLARINFIKSRLVYESFCDFSKDVDLVSQEILLADTRFQDMPANKRANVFATILQPMKLDERSSLLQAEVHYRATKDVNRFTILLNNMRLMCVLDWWLALLGFLTQDSPKPGPAPAEEVPERREVTRMVDLRQEPLYPTTGVVTRRNPVVVTAGPVFELKLNITDSEVVVVADTAQWESSAVILRSTTVLAFRPDCRERPLSCNLSNAEVFSCVLGKEADTALSIIDPVTINLEVWGRGEVLPSVRGLMDVDQDSKEVERVADIQLQQLNVRLSYHDAIMFRDILNSLPKQAQDALAGAAAHREEGPGDASPEPANVRAQVDQLEALGFSRPDCREALRQAANQLDEAALWLTQNASPPRASPAAQPAGAALQTCFFPGTSVSFSTVQLKMSCINLVVIDDCKDADCPLVELSLASLHLKQRQDGSGCLASRLSASYYNRELSAWEPCMEPWGCEVDWLTSRLGGSAGANRNAVTIKSSEVVNLNLTSSLLELGRRVRADWGEDGEVEGPVQSAARRRTRFVPFALRNQTGCPLVFHCRVVAAQGHRSGQPGPAGEALGEDGSWVEVADGQTVPFMFEGRSKARLASTHQHQLHQLVVRVEGWREIRPVSVDRVGTFFRNVAAVRPSSSFTEIPPARLVFAVTLEGSARKLITVRSALEVENRLEVPLRLRLENTFLRVADVKEVELPAGQRLPLPLLYCWASVLARPVVGSSHNWTFSEQPIHWCHILSPTDNTLVLHTSSHQLNPRAGPFRFCVSVRRLGFPCEALAIGPGSRAWVQPAHRVTFLPPLALLSLLPCALHWQVQDSELRGAVRPGAETQVLVDIFSIYVLDFCLEGFPGRGSLIMQPGAGAFEARIKLSDARSRPVHLTVKVTVRCGGAVHITVFAPYWIVNKTGLPLLFKQEDSKAEAAGQFEEHELARMVAPLLFSFPERDSQQSLVARAGQGLNSEGSPRWCKNFHVQPGCTVRRLRVQPPAHDKRPEWVYIVGIDVRPGRGRYRLTTVITLSPRFQLYNQSQHKIQFSQHCFATSFQDPGAEKTFLTAHPNSSLAFHWPRLDMDQLLCMRLLDVPGSQWTGGFLIERVDSFQLASRDRHGRASFLRLEISLNSSTFCIVISSADNFPPPFRVDNFSEVPIVFYQTGVSDQLLRCTVRPHQSVPYALDGPILPPHLTVAAPGGSVATYNMDTTGAGSELTYENFIYIAVGGSEGRDWREGEDCALVLDVPEGSRVVLGRKAGSQRSQLWRMTSTGMLQHEGSSPPQDPRSAKAPDAGRTLVLDIAGPSEQPFSPTNFVPLMLRKPDPRRSLTQHWRFTEDGRLCCQHAGLYVQAGQGATLGLAAGRDVVLGPTALVCLERTAAGVPAEQAVERQRLRPGSGCLGVRVTTDGPTRVLQVSDRGQPRERSYARAEEPDWLETKKPWLVTAEGGAGRRAGAGPGREERGGELQVVLLLKGGLGLSLVNKEPGEELVYCCLTNIVVDYQSLPRAQLLDGSVQSIQVDNQTGDCSLHTLLYVSPSSKSDDSRHLPAIHFAINRTPPSTASPNAEIFRHLILTIKNLTINVEEELLYKVCRFAGLGRSDLAAGQDEAEEAGGWEQHLLATSAQLARYYFGTLKLTLAQIKLSVQKSTKLSHDLVDIKRKLGLSLITFEDAAIELDPFSKSHPFETLPFLTSIIMKHYQDELISQAVLILGSTDFLGNPLGFLNDVQEGVSGLVTDGNLGGLVKNVAHGAANSAAKMTGSLSYGLSKASLDQKYDDRRLLLKRKQSDNSQQHLMAGLKGLGFGMLGGLTSVITEPLQGAASAGVPGFLQGLGWGAVGVVTKPVIGILDMATETASAVRESSRSASRAAPPRVRPARVVQGPGGTLPPFSDKQAAGQTWLHRIVGARPEELYVGFEQLGGGLMVVVSSERVVVFTVSAEGRERPVHTVGLAELELALPRTVRDGETGESGVVVELVTRGGGTLVQRPQVRCEGELLASSVCNTINYARAQHEEARGTVGPEEAD